MRAPEPYLQEQAGSARDDSQSLAKTSPQGKQLATGPHILQMQPARMLQVAGQDQSQAAFRLTSEWDAAEGHDDDSNLVR